MKRILAALAALAIGLSLNAASLKTETMADQGLTRTYHMYIPDGLTTKDAPVVIIMHGYGGNANGYLKKYYPLADEYGFALCYPQGATDSKGKTCWNVGYPWQIDAMKVDDCEFIVALKNHIVEEYGFSAKNVFLTGNSNGGEMCYLMAMRKPKEFTAIASMYGLTLVDMVQRYSYSEPVDFMELHGTGDMTSRWEGDPENQYGWGAYMAVPMAVGAVIAVNKCVRQETTVLPVIKNKVTLHRYFGSPYGKEVLFYEVQNGGHNMADDSFDSYRAVMDFFKSHLVK